MNNRSRLVFLRILLVMSIIGSGMCMMSYLSMALLKPQMQEVMENYEQIFPSEASILLERLMDVPSGVYLTMALLSALSLAGVIMMWMLRKAGFHCYTMAQLLLIIVPLLFIGKSYVGLGDIMFTVLFVAAYWSLLRQLGVFGKAEEDSPKE